MELGLFCLNTVAEKAISKHPDKLKEFKKGKVGLIGLFVGEAMIMTKGLADPKKLHEIVVEKLNA